MDPIRMKGGGMITSKCEGKNYSYPNGMNNLLKPVNQRFICNNFPHIIRTGQCFKSHTQDRHGTVLVYWPLTLGKDNLNSQVWDEYQLEWTSLNSTLPTTYTRENSSY